jgi:hypothetical protein
VVQQIAWKMSARQQRCASIRSSAGNGADIGARKRARRA